MKKAIALLLAIGLLLAMTTGCGGSGKTDDPKGSPTPTSPSGNNGGKALLPSEAYTKYLEVKGNAYDRISAKIEENEDLALSVGMALLPILFIDLALIPITVIGMGDAVDYMGMLGYVDMKIEQNGSVYSITYQDSEGVSVKMTCEYDQATDSIQSVIFENDQKAMIFEYVKAGNGYASQCIMMDSETGEYAWMGSFFDETSFVGYGIMTLDHQPNSIYKNTKLTSDFIINDQSYFVLDNNTLTVMENGAVKTY